MTIMTDWIDTMQDYGFEDFEQTTLARLLDDAHKEVCLREPWPFLERQVSFTVPGAVSVLTTNGVTFVSAPNDPLAASTMRLVTATSTLNNSATTLYTDYTIGKVLAFVNTTDSNVLVPLRNDVQLKDFVYDLTTTGVPTQYYFVGDELTLWPIPDGNKTLKIRYLQEPLTLTSTSLDAAILWPARHDSVVLYSALSKADLINDDPQSAVMQQVMEQRLQVARNDLWMKQFDRTDRVIVLDDNDYNF